MLKDKHTLKGTVHIVLKDKDGKVLDERTFPNLVVSSGLNWVASRMTSGSDAVMSHMAVGSGSTAPALGDTTLQTEVSRIALASATSLLAQVRYVATFGAGVGTGSLQEAGIFNAGSSGTMLCRTTFAVVNKGASDTLQITWTVSGS